ncbi:hypothetical protein BLD25_01685 [Candidatus Gracilibacteria bacterium GN02-872]|nr:hypothetical protein BLD25_01685 [Candidatus Gracilibacteria bacterium GN02-872]
MTIYIIYNETMFIYIIFIVMNTLRKEDLLLDQPSVEEQKELLEIFKELDVKVQEKIDIVMNKSSACNGNGGGGNCGGIGSCAGCK